MCISYRYIGEELIAHSNSNVYRSDLYWDKTRNVAVMCLDNDVNVDMESLHTVTNLQRRALTTNIDLQSAVLRVLAIDCTSSESCEYLVYRHELEILDVKHVVKCEDLNLQDSETIDFMKALIKFPEWDDFDRGSYAWPNLIVDMIRSPKEWNEWRRCVGMYMTRGRSAKFVLCHLLHQSRSKVYLFFLCLAHVGYDVDKDLGSLLLKLKGVVKMSCDNDSLMPSSLPSSLPTSPVRLSSPPARPRDSPLSQGSSGAKRTKSGHLCSLLSLGAPTSTIQANPHEKVADVVTGKDRGALTLSLTVPESCVLDLIECIRSDSVQEIDEQNFDLSFKRTSCRVGVNFQVDDLPDVTAVNVQDREKLDREKEDFCVFKPGMMNDNELDSYLQQVYDTVPVEAGDLVGVCDHTSHSGFSNLSLDLKQGSNIGGGGASFATGDNVSGCDKDNLQVMDVAEVKSRKPEWRIWNEKFRETRLRLPLNYNQIGGCGKATSVGVVVACESDGDDSVKPSKVWIYNGGETHFSVSTNDIRLMTFTEDRALDVLHRSGYCSSQALQAVGRSCASGSFRDTIHWAPQDINNLNEVFKGYVLASIMP